MISFLYKKERKIVHSVHSLEARVGIAGASDYQYDRYSPWVTANGFMNFVYMPYNCSAD